ncbi:MAG: tetratricopeptide repeat protein [Deltaproteobacteria bacterium]|nr:tetratricopeptide repeat protein [Deltaproteobacteria bacterium]
MDQFSAHLDRAWDLVASGDTHGARSSARHAQQIDPNSPEVHNLLGYISAADGDADEALEHYRQAMALDDGYLEPVLNAAELLVHPLADYDQAIQLCDEALEFAESPEELADALLLKFDALLGKGDKAAAAEVLEELPAGPYETANYDFLIGRAFYDVGRLDDAEERLVKAALREPQHADAHYYLGVIADDRGDPSVAGQHFVIVREIDARAPHVAWSPSREEFGKVVDQAISELPGELVVHIAGARIYPTEAPGIELCAEGCDPRIPVLVDGVDGDAAARLFVYQRNVERYCYSLEVMKTDLPKLIAREIETVFASPDAGSGAD